MSRKTAAVTIFRTLRFFVTFLFFSLTRWGFWSPRNNSATITKNRGCNYLSYFTIFRYFFAFLTCQAGLPNSTSSAKKKKKKGEKSGRQRFSLLTIFRYILFFLSYQTALPNWTNSAKIEKNRGCTSRFLVTSSLLSLTREGFRIQLIPRKVQKIVPIPHFDIFPYVFITWQNGRCKTHCPCTALNPAIVLIFQLVIWRTVRALISRLFNIFFPRLAIYITALLNHMSSISNSKAAARDATLCNAGEILMWTDHKVSSIPYE